MCCCRQRCPSQGGLVVALQPEAAAALAGARKAALQAHRPLLTLWRLLQGSIPFVPYLRAPYYVWIGHIPQLATVLEENRVEAPPMFPPTFLYTQSWEDPRPDMEVAAHLSSVALFCWAAVLVIAPLSCWAWMCSGLLLQKLGVQLQLAQWVLHRAALSITNAWY